MIFCVIFAVVKTGSSKILPIIVAVSTFALPVAPCRADDTVDTEASLTMGAASGSFTPFYQGSNAGGRRVAAGNLQIEAKAVSPLSLDRRLSWSAGVDLIGDFAESLDYSRYDSGNWSTTSIHPARARIQQLFATIKWRGVFLTAGMKEERPAMGDPTLSSGDLVHSGNARPIPGVRVGFIDFQDIPFTRGWVQIQGEVMYGKMTDSDWWDNMASRYSYHVAGGQWYNYKRCYFRTSPGQPFSVTVGMQAAATFGGWTRYYNKGEVTRYNRRHVKAWDLVKMLIPTQSGGEDFYEGNHLGSWDLEARWRLPQGDEIKGRFSWPWEDGSGIGRRNGWDGLWGIEYHKAGEGHLLQAATVEYIDMTNQSGPIHFAPSDRPGTTIPNQATGADDYYNNGYYNSYANYGLSIGSPMLMAPAFNLDGYPAYIGNRMRGFHVAARGMISPRVGWLVKGGYRKAWGNGKIMLLHPIHLTAAMLEVSYTIPRVDNLKVNASLEINRGNMPGNSFGGLLTVSYSPSFKLKKK